VSDDLGALMGIAHAAMLSAMLLAMLVRFDEYAGCGRAPQATA
jgi:hypothetical protein